MEAMILAAGEGRRLAPLTDATPKALLEVAGVPILERVARELISAGADRLIVNAHHLAERIDDWARAQTLGVPVLVSREDEVSSAPLDTGGGLLHAAPLFEAEAPFLLHNADVLSELDLARLYREHVDGEARDGRLATLTVMERPTSRPLLVDDEGLFGRANRTEGWEVIARHPAPGASAREVGFAGIHALSEKIFGRLTERGAFSIVETYVRLVGEGERIAIFDATGVVWRDIGTPERLAAARGALAAPSAGGTADP